MTDAEKLKKLDEILVRMRSAGASIDGAIALGILALDDTSWKAINRLQREAYRLLGHIGSQITALMRAERG